MKTVENHLQPSRVKLEVETESEKKIELSLCQKCRVFCHCETIMIYLVLLGIGGSLFYMYSQQESWLFFTLGSLSWLLVVSFFIRTCIAVSL